MHPLHPHWKWMTVQQTLFYHTEKIFVQKDLYSKTVLSKLFFCAQNPFFCKSEARGAAAKVEESLPHNSS
jgi:hypothetical protein